MRAAHEWFKACIQEERRSCARRVAQAEAKQEAMTQELQRLRLRIASDPRAASASASLAEEDSYLKMKEKLGKETAEKWRRVQEAHHERDQARKDAREAAEASERLQHENVLLRGEMARLQKRLGKLHARGVDAAEAREGPALGEDRSAGAGDGTDAEAHAADDDDEEEWFNLLLRQMDVDDERERRQDEDEDETEDGEPRWQPASHAERAAAASMASSQWSTVGWVGAQPAVAEAIAAALVHSLPRGSWPSAAKSADDHMLERALLRRMAEPGAAEAGSGGVGARGLREALNQGGAIEKLAIAIWPAVEKLAAARDAL